MHVFIIIPDGKGQLKFTFYFVKNRVRYFWCCQRQHCFTNNQLDNNNLFFVQILYLRCVKFKPFFNYYYTL